MDDYNFAADLLATFRASPDFIKALVVLIPPCFMLAFIRLMLALPRRRKPWKAAFNLRPEPPNQQARPSLDVANDALFDQPKLQHHIPLQDRMVIVRNQDDMR